MGLTYYVCDLRSGQVLDELPVAADELTRTVAREESQSFTLNTADPSCPPEWNGLVVPGKAMIVAVPDDADPLVGWAVVSIEVGAAQVPVSCVTLEHCLSRVNVATIEDYGVDEGTAAGVVAAKMESTHGFDVEVTPTGRALDEVVYDETEDRSIFQALSDLMAADGGPEWRVVLRWTDETRQHISKVIEIGPRVGLNRPEAVFDLDDQGRGCVENYRRTVDYTTDHGATYVIGTSDGSGSVRPMSSPYASNLTTLDESPWPVWEARPSFTGIDAPNIDDPEAELERRARAELRRRATGARVWQLTGSGQYAPRPGYEFDAGDTVQVDIAPQPHDPEGGTFAARVVGWTWNTKSGAVTPILWEDDDS